MIIGAGILTQIEDNTLQDTATILASVVMGGVFGLYLFGFITKRGGIKAVWFGISITLLFSIWTVLMKKGYLPDWMSVPFDLYYTGFMSHIVMFTFIFAGTMIFITKKMNLKNLTVWTQDKSKIE